MRLCEVVPVSRVVVAEVSDHDPELLRYLGKLNVYPGTSLEVVQVEPFDRSMEVRIGEQIRVLSALVTRCIWVTDVQALDA